MKHKVSLYCILILGFIFLLPILITVSSSFMTPEELLLSPDTFTLIPQKISIRQYYTLLFERLEYLAMFWKSIFLTLTIVISNGLYSTFMGTMLAKAKLRGKNIILTLFILAMILPHQITMLPHYILFKFLHLLESDWALILSMLFAPTGVILVFAMVSITSNELIEAVRLETNSLWYIFKDAIFPVVKGGFIILIIFIFSESWNMVEQPMNVYSTINRQPLSVLLAYMKYDPSIVFAASVIYMIPIIIIYYFFHESLEENLIQLNFKRS